MKIFLQVWDQPVIIETVAFLERNGIYTYSSVILFSISKAFVPPFYNASWTSPTLCLCSIWGGFIIHGAESCVSCVSSCSLMIKIFLCLLGGSDW